MQQPLSIQCPWCFETMTLWVAYDDLGHMITDCEVCCRPWQLWIQRDSEGDLSARVERS